MGRALPHAVHDVPSCETTRRVPFVIAPIPRGLMMMNDSRVHGDEKVVQGVGGHQRRNHNVPNTNENTRNGHAAQKWKAIPRF